MTTDTRPSAGFYGSEDCDIAEFASLVECDVARNEIPRASDASGNVPVYESGELAACLMHTGERAELMAEWANILQYGPGAFVIKNAQSNHSAIDAATAVYNDIIDREKETTGGGADHFAAAGSNDRIWNSLQKLCETAPETFIQYFACP
ncbi:MAG: phytanoyl-CoA dioxygenase family protein, partial [Methyloligellaceae bacterium]